MFKKIAVFLIFILVFFVCICACQATQPAQKDAQTFYIEYLEALKCDPQAGMEYRHYEDPEAKELAIAHTQKLLDYEIIRMEKLSDNLWEVILFSKTEEFSEGVYGANYIGIIDDQYYVMTSSRQIPESLKEGIEIEPFAPSGPSIIGSGDVIAPIN